MDQIVRVPDKKTSCINNLITGIWCPKSDIIVRMTLFTTHQDNKFKIGDIVRVHQKIQEDAKTRIQVFEGMVIAIQGKGISKNFIVRRMGVNDVAIERIFPLSSPLIEKVEVKTQGFAKRAKLYYIREKSTREIAEITKPRTSQQSKSLNLKKKR